MGLAFLITTGNLQLLSERKVLKAVEYSALLNAEGVIAAAREEADSLLQQSRETFEKNKRDGYEQGVARAQAEYGARLCRSALESAAALQAMRFTMADIVVRAVREMVAAIDPAQLYDTALRKVCAMVDDKAFITVRVSPTQEAVLWQVVGAMSAAQEDMPTIRIVADPGLDDERLVIETPAGTVEAGMDVQLEALGKALGHGGGNDAS